MKSFYTIKCPKCGWEHLPEEVYVKILGDAKNIVRNEEGKILFFEGNTMDLHEEYTCDNPKCNCTFTIDMRPTFVTKVNVQHDFSEDYSTTIYDDRITLEEPKELKTKELW